MSKDLHLPLKPTFYIYFCIKWRSYWSCFLELHILIYSFQIINPYSFSRGFITVPTEVYMLSNQSGLKQRSWQIRSLSTQDLMSGLLVFIYSCRPAVISSFFSLINHRKKKLTKKLLTINFPKPKSFIWYVLKIHYSGVTYPWCYKYSIQYKFWIPPSVALYI